MPELANLSLPSPILSLSNCSNNLNQPLPQLQQSPRSDFNSRSSSQTLALGHDSDRDFRFPVKGDGVDEGGESEPRVLKRARGSVDLVRKRAGADKSFQDRIKDPSSLPFLVGAPKEVDCSFCQRFVNPGEEISCSVRGCGTCYHKECAKEAGGILNKNKFKCPQHDLPLPYIKEEFKIDLTWKDMDNIYLVKKKRSDADDGEGCTSCSSTCSDDCVCRVQCISCSKACRCSENCNNRPFRKEKRIKLVKTELCGWGVEAVEAVDKGGFIIEYIGEGLCNLVQR
ncbi:hypothetical protein TanjilG_27610 [Lupinus angustifolius]|uniref:AWS domain-containing protein n=1 Tax=Lupinus angustifolius TaxID=3871 RepID=A0A1J7GDN5_LUPAN|nr:hypothetical protein TanjilG_27610 [Lupinus angustifolius]